VPQLKAAWDAAVAATHGSEVAQSLARSEYDIAENTHSADAGSISRLRLTEKKQALKATDASLEQARANAEQNHPDLIPGELLFKPQWAAARALYSVFSERPLSRVLLSSRLARPMSASGRQRSAPEPSPNVIARVLYRPYTSSMKGGKSPPPRTIFTQEPTMESLSEQAMKEKIKRRETFSATIDGGGFSLKIDRYEPAMSAAIHNGGYLRAPLTELCLLSQAERYYEEDPFTGSFIDRQPITLIGHDSRYEYDLNRTTDECVLPLTYFAAESVPIWLALYTIDT
jgi:hypothetical protein